jgi:uncharacterized membrane protein YfcA
MMPLTLVGSFVGAYIYVSFPELILEIMLTIILLLLSIQSFFKAIQITKKEYFSDSPPEINQIA